MFECVKRFFSRMIVDECQKPRVYMASRNRDGSENWQCFNVIDGMPILGVGSTPTVAYLHWVSDRMKNELRGI